MSIITLTTDLGHNSHYPAMIKGVVHSLFPRAHLIDVTHDIANFNVMEAAYVARNVLRAYPEGTIHLVSVDPTSGRPPDSCIAMQFANQYFVGPNNGLMSLICEHQPQRVVAIEKAGLTRDDFPISFRAGRCFAPTAAFLASGGTLDEIGPDTELQELRWGDPTYSGNCLRGKIIHVDRFGNAITNIGKSYFISLKAERSFEIFVRNVRLRRIVNTYSDVGKADALAIFGLDDRLEIAMREASAADLLGLSVHDMVTIEFRGG